MTLQSERARFEEWVGKRNGRTVRYPVDGRYAEGEYKENEVQYGWEAWCAALGIKEDKE